MYSPTRSLQTNMDAKFAQFAFQEEEMEVCKPTSKPEPLEEGFDLSLNPSEEEPTSRKRLRKSSERDCGHPTKKRKIAETTHKVVPAKKKAGFFEVEAEEEEEGFEPIQSSDEEEEEGEMTSSLEQFINDESIVHSQDQDEKHMLHVYRTSMLSQAPSQFVQVNRNRLKINVNAIQKRIKQPVEEALTPEDMVTTPGDNEEEDSFIDNFEPGVGDGSSEDLYLSPTDIIFNSPKKTKGEKQLEQLQRDRLKRLAKAGKVHPPSPLSPPRAKPGRITPLLPSRARDGSLSPPGTHTSSPGTLGSISPPSKTPQRPTEDEMDWVKPQKRTKEKMEPANISPPSKTPQRPSEDEMDWIKPRKRQVYPETQAEAIEISPIRATVTPSIKTLSTSSSDDWDSKSSHLSKFETYSSSKSSPSPVKSNMTSLMRATTRPSMVDDIEEVASLPPQPVSPTFALALQAPDVQPLPPQRELDTSILQRTPTKPCYQFSFADLNVDDAFWQELDSLAKAP